MHENTNAYALPQQDLISDKQVTKQLNKFEYIDVLRGIAILGVMATHSQQQIADLSKAAISLFNYGQIGVQLFFVASALTLCLSMSGRQESSPRNFYVRRFFRIAPLYYFGIVLYFLWRILKDYYKLDEAPTIPNYNILGVVENILFIHGFHPKNFNFVVPGGWSISTEMSFYLIFPVLFAIQSKLGFKKFLHLSVAIMACSFAIQFVVIDVVGPLLLEKHLILSAHTNDEFGFIYCSVLNQINVFLIGILTYKILDRKKVPNILLAVAVLLCAISCYLLNTTELKTGYNGFVFPILSAIAFGIFTIKLSSIQRFHSLPSKVIARIGQVSFSMYLLHFLFLDIVTFIFRKTIFTKIHFPELQLLILYCTIIAVTFIASQISYKLIEDPAIRFGKRFIR